MGNQCLAEPKENLTQRPNDSNKNGMNTDTLNHPEQVNNSKLQEAYALHSVQVDHTSNPPKIELPVKTEQLQKVENSTKKDRKSMNEKLAYIQKLEQEEIKQDFQQISLKSNQLPILQQFVISTLEQTL